MPSNLKVVTRSTVPAGVERSSKLCIGAWSRHASTLQSRDGSTFLNVEPVDRSTIQHSKMWNRRPQTRSAFNNDECHVTAFRPISEAARSWSLTYDAP